jgi:hypothetical protein
MKKYLIHDRFRQGVTLHPKDQIEDIKKFSEGRIIQTFRNGIQEMTLIQRFKEGCLIQRFKEGVLSKSLGIGRGALSSGRRRLISKASKDLPAPIPPFYDVARL